MLPLDSSVLHAFLKASDLLVAEVTFDSGADPARRQG